MPGRPIPHRRGPEITDEDMVSINGVLAEAYGPNGAVRKTILASLPPLPPARPTRPLTEKELEEVLGSSTLDGLTVIRLVEGLRETRGELAGAKGIIQHLAADLRAARAVLRDYGVAAGHLDHARKNRRWMDCDDYFAMLSAADKKARAQLPPEDSND